jgi:fructokinase
MTSSTKRLIGGIEAGGTKFNCGIARLDGTIIGRVRITTTTPGETLNEAARFFEEHIDQSGTLEALSIASFGPLSLDPKAADFGKITATPKPGWTNTDLVRYFQERLGTPILLDTDVNGAAVAEHLFGNARGLDTFCYVTVGTGIGVGTIAGGTPYRGANHLEAGHISVPRAPDDDQFKGICPFHGECLEGLACGPAMKARWGVSPMALPEDHPAWLVEADYIAALCANLTYIARPQCIIIGGGVMQRPHIYPLVRLALAEKLGGYDASLRDIDLDRYVVEPGVGAAAGLWGAIANAYRHIEGKWPTQLCGAPAYTSGENCIA